MPKAKRLDDITPLDLEESTAALEFEEGVFPEIYAEDKRVMEIWNAENQRLQENVNAKRVKAFFPANIFTPIKRENDRRPVISQKERYKFNNGNKQRRARILNSRIREIQIRRCKKEKGIPHKLVEVLSYYLLQIGACMDKSYDDASRLLGIHPDTIENCIHWLDQQGWLDYFHTRGVTANGKRVRRANAYIFHDPAEDTFFKRVLRAARPVLRSASAPTPTP